MLKNFKKIFCFILIIAMAFSALVACVTPTWGPIGGGPNTATDTVGENGGFAVEYGNYVYFVNGMVSYDSDNVFGEVIKGSICRRPKNKTGDEDVEIIVPKIMVNGYSDGGFYIFGDYIYYTTPNSERGSTGSVTSSIVDFMRVKIDGTGTVRIAKLDPSKNTTSDIPYKFFKADDSNVYLVYYLEEILYKINTAARSFSAATLDENVLTYAFGDTEIYYTRKETYKNAQNEDVDESFNTLRKIKPNATAEGVDISPAADVNSQGKKTHTYTIKKFDKGILFFTKAYALDGDNSLWGYNEGTAAIKRFAHIAVDNFLALGWNDGLIAYTNNMMYRYMFKTSGTNETVISFPFYEKSSVTLYFVNKNQGKWYLFYGIADTSFYDNSGSGVTAAHIWRLEIPDDTRIDNPLLNSETQRITQNAVHNSWLKPKLIDGYIYFINCNNIEDYNDDYTEEGYQYYTYITDAYIAHGTSVANISEIWIGIHDETEIEDD